MTIPQKLNWVEVRFSCTLAAMFHRLCDEIKADVKMFNSFSGASEQDGFQADMHPDGKTIGVERPNEVPRRRVLIGLGDGKIRVLEEWDPNKKWEVSIGLNCEGRCILRLDGEIELEQWQFRMKALERLFFDGRNK